MSEDKKKLLEACGRSSKVMREMARELKNLGLEAQADLLDRIGFLFCPAAGHKCRDAKNGCAKQCKPLYPGGPFIHVRIPSKQCLI